MNENLTTTSEASHEEITRWVKQLGSLLPSRRKRAQEALQMVGAAALEPLVEAAKKRENFQHIAYRMGYMLGGICLIGVLASAIGMRYGFSDGTMSFASACFLASLLGVGLCGVGLMSARDLNRRGMEAWRLLSKLKDGRLVGFAATAQMKRHNRLEKYLPVDVSRTLVGALSAVGKAEADALTKEERDALLSILKSAGAWYDGKFADVMLAAVLRAEQIIRDVNALPLAQKLTRHENAEVQAAARACLAILEEERERLRAHDTLLRGSEAPTHPDTLLRPAQATRIEEPQQLLRASAGDSERK